VTAQQQAAGVELSQRKQRQIDAFELRLAGHDLRSIGRQLGVSHETVRRDIEAEIEERKFPLVMEWREVELQRLEKLQLALVTTLAEKTKTAEQALAITDRLLKIADRRAKLLGLDAPVQTEVQVNVTEVTQAETELTELLNEARAKAAAIKATQGQETAT
jgi:orotate phosphoribosyltransferase-like protein